MKPASHYRLLTSVSDIFDSIIAINFTRTNVSGPETPPIKQYRSCKVYYQPENTSSSGNISNCLNVGIVCCRFIQIVYSLKPAASLVFWPQRVNSSTIGSYICYCTRCNCSCTLLLNIFASPVGEGKYCLSFDFYCPYILPFNWGSWKGYTHTMNFYDR